MNYLEINHIKKSFGDLEVLKDISLTVKKGEVLAIIGPSGSGKSTLLRCATLLETMDGGDLSYLGEKAVSMDASGRSVYAKPAELREIRKKFGLVFQNFNLFPHYSVIKNVTDPLIHVQKKSKEEAYRIGRELLKKMGLSDKEDYYPCPAFRRSAAACLDRAGSGLKSPGALFRRAHLCPGPGAYGRDLKSHP